MRFFLFLFIVFSKFNFAQFTTPNTYVVWNLDSLVQNSGGIVTGIFPNYTINGKIIVSSNDLLIIPAGAKVIFTSTNGGFDINGVFRAVGTEIDSIVFTATVPDSQGFYEGFRFNANPNSNQSLIKYARIFYADYGFRCIDASPQLSNSYLFKCLRGVQLSASNAIIKNNVIERSYEFGITMTLNSSPLIEGNHLIKNNTRATSAMNQISIGLQGNNSPIIRNNIIEGGESILTGGISLWVNGPTSFSNSIIENNRIFNNSFGITLYSTSNGIINTIIRNNFIYNNKINPNHQTSGSGININGSSFNRPIITNNIIYGNWWGITIQNGTIVQTGPQPNIGNVENIDSLDDGKNIIFNNLQGNFAYDLYNNCTNDIFAQNNDWQVYDSTLIEQNIFHKVDNALHGLVKFIPFSMPIPVDFISFVANVIGNNVELNWCTATEINNKGYEVQRFLNNKWEFLAFITGKGTTAEFSSYYFIDKNLSDGNYFYRLKQIDFNGEFSYSKIIEVKIDSNMDFTLFQNYPNPFNPSTTISFFIPDKFSEIKNITIKLFDILGREVDTIVDGYFSTGKHSILFTPNSTLPAGVYFYQLQTRDFIKTNKMILVR